jgi:glycosyltransferase involved in cell wall biosynthesis
MQHRRPTVSVALAVRNNENTVRSAITSVINQTFRDWELLLIDDGSNDGTSAVARLFKDSRIQVFVDNHQLGLPSRLNQAVALSLGKYIARMDGDDIMYPDRLAKQVAFLDAHQEVDLLGGGMVVFRGDGVAYGCRIPLLEHKEICRRPWSGIGLAHPTWMGRTEWFRHNPYREDALRMEDKDLLFRTYRKSKFANLAEIVLGYREDTLTLAKIVPARKNFCRVLMDSAGHEISYSQACRGLAGQVVRLVADTIAIKSKLNEKLLRHRARALTPEVRERWEAVWSSIATAARVSTCP